MEIVKLPKFECGPQDSKSSKIIPVYDLVWDVNKQTTTLLDEILSNASKIYIEDKTD